MTYYIDKEALICALKKEEYSECTHSFNAMFALERIRVRVQKGEFDAKPKNICENCRYCYIAGALRGLTGVAIVEWHGCNNPVVCAEIDQKKRPRLNGEPCEHFDAKRGSTQNDQPGIPCSKPWATKECYAWCMVNHVCKYEARGDRNDTDGSSQENWKDRPCVIDCNHPCRTGFEPKCNWDGKRCRYSP